MSKFNLTSFLVENKLTRLGRLSEGYMDGEYASTEEMAEKGMYEEESEVEEDYSKYGSANEANRNKYQRSCYEAQDGTS